MNRKPKILFYDIEVTPNSVYTWPSGKKYDLNVVGVVKPWEILSFSYSWEGDRRIHTVTKEGQRSDKALVVKLRSIINSAEVIVTHNGERSDQPRTRTRLVKHGLKPLANVASIDTCLQARRIFSFDGNSLQDLAGFLSVGKKLPNPGFDMWTGCMKDDAKSWRFMARYNAHDVRLLKEVFKKLRPHLYTQPSMTKLLGLDPKGTCPSCTSTNVRKDGIRPTAAGVKQRMCCQSCGHPYSVPMPKVKKI